MLSPRTKWEVTATRACRGIAVGIVVLTLAGVAHAAPILTLFNTGVFANGTLEPNGTLGDPHYTLVSVPSGLTAIQARTSAGGFPIPPWLADDTLSTWIGPTTLTSPAGNYDYRTTFDLTGFTPGTASITGKWATDNSGVDIRLNGVSTGQTSASFTAFTAFTLTTGFSAGINTLDFIVNNAVGVGQNPTGLRVEMAGAATVAPEPASFLLFGAGLVGLSLIPRRRVQGRTRVN